MERYATRDLIEEHKVVPSPRPTSEQIKVYVDSLIYSKDSLKCAATVIVDVLFDKKANYSNPKYEHNYDGFALLGFRDSKDEQFNIYFMDIDLFLGFDNYKQVSRMLKNSYIKGLKDAGSTAGTHVLRRYYQCGFGDSNFFSQAPDFQQDSLGNYWCEFIRHGPYILPTEYHSNKKKVIKKDKDESEVLFILSNELNN